MGTRIICFIIAITFTISVVVASVYAIYDSLSKDSPKTAEELKVEALEALRDYGNLADFNPPDSSPTEISQLEIVTAAPEDALEVVIQDKELSLSYSLALADTGQIYDISLNNPPAEGTDLKSLKPQAVKLPSAGNLPTDSWKQLVIGAKVGSKVRWFVPADKVLGSFAQAGDFPRQQDIIVELGIDSVATRVQIEGFVPLGAERITELRTEDIVVGSGETVKTGDKVVLNYIGVLASSGIAFDNNDEVEFELAEGQLIKGFLDGMTGMKVGGKRRVLIPAADGYGDQDSNPAIPADSDLVFEIELKEIKPPADEAGSQN